MSFPVLFGISVAFGLTIWGAVAWHYYLASTQRTPQPGEPEAHPTAAWVQVSRIGICSAGCCVFTVTCRICSTGSLRRFHDGHSGFARSGCPGNPCRDGGNLDFQYFRNGGPALWFLPGSRDITPSYARLVRGWLLYPVCVRAASVHNAWLGVPNTGANERYRPVPQESEYRLMPGSFSVHALGSGQLRRGLTD